jgi:toxin ParE1/3/4
MAKIVWTLPAIADLDAIADYIAIENPNAAAALVQRVVKHVTQLVRHPESGSKPLELSRCRQIIEPRCRVFYRFDRSTIFILYVLRGERVLRPRQVAKRAVAAKMPS